MTRSVHAASCTLDITISSYEQKITDNLQVVVLNCASYTIPNPLPAPFNIKISDPTNNCSWQPQINYDPKNPDVKNCIGGKCSFPCGYNKNFQLAVFNPRLNKLFISNKETIKSSKNIYAMDLLPDSSAILQDKTPLLKRENYFLLRFEVLFNVITELIVAFFYLFFIKKVFKKILITIAIMSLITTVFFFSLERLNLPINIISIVPFKEFIKAIIEGYAIHFFNKKQIDLKQSFILCLVANALRFFLFYILAFIIVFVAFSGSTMWP